MLKKFPPTIFSLRIDKIFYGLFLVERGYDESLYIKFPRNAGYEIKSANEFIKVPTNITLKENTVHIYNPYVTYHQSGSIHINAQDSNNRKIKFIKDKIATEKIALSNKKEYFPFCSMLLPVNIAKYDVINSVFNLEVNSLELSNKPILSYKDNMPKPSVIVIDRDMLPNKAMLYIEVFIHKKLDDHKEELSFNSLQKRNLIKQITVNNAIASISFTLLIKWIPTKEENPAGEIVINVFNKENMITLSLISV